MRHATTPYCGQEWCVTAHPVAQGPAKSTDANEKGTRSNVARRLNGCEILLSADHTEQPDLGDLSLIPKLDVDLVTRRRPEFRLLFSRSCTNQQRCNALLLREKPELRIRLLTTSHGDYMR